MSRAAMVLAALLAAAPASAEEPRALFALIVGVNQSVDAELAPLRYADDDAARYLDLFRTLGARTYLLTRLDENTRRLHPQAAAEATLPRREEFDRAVAALAKDVDHARQEGVATEVYFVYAGHGNVRDGAGYISLEDARLTGSDLKSAILDKVPATRLHFIIDACHSYFLAYGRGPGGQRRAIDPGFSQAMQLSSDGRVGLLLSTSSARESHEWEGFQAGIFSHEVRSGLFGAADVDGDGEVSYREIAAFVERANAAIPNEKFRPEVWARPPLGSQRLVDLHGGLARRLEIDGAHAARYLLEDSRGVRLADFHNSPGQALKLLRPLTAGGTLYLRRLPDEQEYVIASTADVVLLADLAPQEPRVHGRGAAHESFERLFELPFDLSVVQGFGIASVLDERSEAVPMATTRIGGIVGWGAGAALVVGGVASLVATNAERSGAKASDSQQAVRQRNAGIESGNCATVTLFSVGGAALVAGTVLYFWPRGAPAVVIVPGATGAAAAISGKF